MWKRVLVIIAIFSIVLFETVSIRSEDPEAVKMLKVEIKGEVNEPGVYYMEKGSCIEDLLKEAEVKDSADLSSISLQQELSNTQIIVIPKKKEEAKKISINSAGISELTQLPGIGEKIAQRIIDYREQYGGFRTLEDLMNVSGIGNVKFNKIKQYITL